MNSDIALSKCKIVLSYIGELKLTFGTVSYLFTFFVNFRTKIKIYILNEHVIYF